MTYREVSQFEPIETVAQLREPADNKGFLVVGNEERAREGQEPGQDAGRTGVATSRGRVS